MPGQPALLSYPDPPLTDAAVLLRRWTESDISCVEEASWDPRIPEGTTVPASFTVADGLAWIERQWGRADNGEGLSLAIADASSDEALGVVVLLFRRQPGTVAIGYWLIERLVATAWPRVQSRSLRAGRRRMQDSRVSRRSLTRTTRRRSVSWKAPVPGAKDTCAPIWSSTLDAPTP